jgi:hypothetical protein
MPLEESENADEPRATTAEDGKSVSIHVALTVFVVPLFAAARVSASLQRSSSSVTAAMIEDAYLSLRTRTRFFKDIHPLPDPFDSYCGVIVELRKISSPARNTNRLCKHRQRKGSIVSGFI